MGEVVVTGTRDLGMAQDQPEIRRVLEKIAADHPHIKTWKLHHGGCRGADMVAGRIAKSLGWTVQVHKADWSLGPSAGPIRNTAMVNAPKKCVAYLIIHPKAKDLTELAKLRGGTADCLRKMQKAKRTARFYQVYDI